MCIYWIYLSNQGQILTNIIYYRVLILAVLSCTNRRQNRDSNTSKKRDGGKDGNHSPKINLEEAWWLSEAAQPPVGQWQTRDSNGEVISTTEWESDATAEQDECIKPLRDTTWEESTAFREMSLAHGRYKVCRVWDEDWSRSFVSKEDRFMSWM